MASTLRPRGAGGSLPEDPRLAHVARTVERAGIVAELVDPEWHLVWVSPEFKQVMGEQDDERIGIGLHLVEACHREPWTRAIGPEARRGILRATAPHWIASPGAEELLDRIPGLRELVGHVGPAPLPPVWTVGFELGEQSDHPARVLGLATRVHDDDGAFVGVLDTFGPALPPHLLNLLLRGDEDMFERMAALVEPGRRQAAVLFADLQESAALSRRLPTSAYFQLIAGVTTGIDKAVIGRRGLIGKHAGDGASAFFLTDDLGSASAAARAAIETARELRRAVAAAVDGAADLVEPEECLLNVGVHWGSALYMGQIVSGGRLEVTALGDEVNEAARIQEAARGGGVLASKSLLEQLSESDAAALGLDPHAISYRTLGELPDAPEKAVRDAGGVPVASLS